MEPARGSHRGVAATSELTSTRCMAPPRRGENSGALGLRGAGNRAGVVSPPEWEAAGEGVSGGPEERSGAEGSGGVLGPCRGARAGADSLTSPRQSLRFFIFIFFIFVFYKNIFSIWKFTGIYPGRPWPPGSGAAGAFLKKNSRRKLRAGP